MILNEPLDFYRISSGSDSTLYHSIAMQIDACSHLCGLSWLDPGTRSLIRKSGKGLEAQAVHGRPAGEALESSSAARAERSSQPYLRDQRLPSWALRRRTVRRMKRRAPSADTADHES